VTEDQWKKIEKTLLPGMDRAHFRKQIERIASDDSPAQRLEKCNYRLDPCRKFLSILPQLEMIEDKSVLTAQLERQIELDRQERDICQQAVSKRSWIWAREYEILLLWVSRGYELPISSNGPHIDFFEPTYEVIFGKEPPDRESIKNNIIRRFRHLKLAEWAGAGNLSAAAEIIPGSSRPEPIPESRLSTEDLQS
jgi:hypothetical protein